MGMCVDMFSNNKNNNKNGTATTTTTTKANNNGHWWYAHLQPELRGPWLTLRQRLQLPQQGQGGLQGGCHTLTEHLMHCIGCRVNLLGEALDAALAWNMGRRV